MKEQGGARTQRQHVVGERGRRGAWAAGGNWTMGRWIAREGPAAAVPWMTISRPAARPVGLDVADPTRRPAVVEPTFLAAGDHVRPGVRRTIAAAGHAPQAALAGHPTGGVTTTPHHGVVAPLPATTSTCHHVVAPDLPRAVAGTRWTRLGVRAAQLLCPTLAGCDHLHSSAMAPTESGATGTTTKMTMSHRRVDRRSRRWG